MNQRGCGPEKMSAVFGARAALFCCLRAATLFVVLGVGACTRIRTRDQLIKSQLLYQLSYAGAPAILASLDLGLRRSTTSSNHPPHCQPARRSCRGSSTCSLELSGFTMTTSKRSSKFTLASLHHPVYLSRHAYKKV